MAIVIDGYCNNRRFSIWVAPVIYCPSRNGVFALDTLRYAQGVRLKPCGQVLRYPTFGNPAGGGQASK